MALMGPRYALSQRLVDRAKADAERARLLDDLLDVLADPAIPDDQAGRITYACNLGYAGIKHRTVHRDSLLRHCERDGLLRQRDLGDCDAGRYWAECLVCALELSRSAHHWGKGNRFLSPENGIGSAIEVVE